MVTAGYSYSSAGASHRAELSFHDVVGIRVLPDEQAHQVVRGTRNAARTTRCAHGPARAASSTTSISRRIPRSRSTGTGRAAPGPRALVLSLVVLAPHYAGLMSNDLPAILRGDVQEYDTYGVYDRLPRQMPLQLGGPTTA